MQKIDTDDQGIEIKCENCVFSGECSESRAKICTHGDYCFFSPNTQAFEARICELTKQCIFTKSELETIGSLLFKAYPDGGTMSDSEYAIYTKCISILKEGEQE